ncbi:MAG: hypothetical protein IPK85_24285 [Gemmatimonadetes bacterium]|nr:hypothetical protein [Gemmatimonadota bacterium]
MRLSVLRPALALLAAACSLEPLGDDVEPETGPGVVYSLVSVNGASIPAQVVQAQTVVEVTRGALTLATDSTFILSYIVRTRGGSSEQVGTITARGSYGLAGTQLAMRVAGDTAVRYRGSHSASDVAVGDVSVPNGDQFVFRR